MPRPNPARSIGGEDTLAERIAYERNARGWSYDQLAQRMTRAGCAIQGSAIYKIERAEPRRRVTVDELVALSRVFEVEVEDLLVPVDEVRDERARELAKRIGPVNEEVNTAVARAVALWVEFLQLAAEDRELWEYVRNHWFVEDNSTNERLLVVDLDDVALADVIDVDPEVFGQALAVIYETIYKTAGSLAGSDKQG